MIVLIDFNWFQLILICLIWFWFVWFDSEFLFFIFYLFYFFFFVGLIDPDFTKATLLTYQSFTTSEILLKKMRERFNAPDVKTYKKKISVCSNQYKSLNHSLFFKIFAANFSRKQNPYPNEGCDSTQTLVFRKKKILFPNLFFFKKLFSAFRNFFFYIEDGTIWWWVEQCHWSRKSECETNSCCWNDNW